MEEKQVWGSVVADTYSEGTAEEVFPEAHPGPPHLNVF